MKDRKTESIDQNQLNKKLLIGDKKKLFEHLPTIIK